MSDHKKIAKNLAFWGIAFIIFTLPIKLNYGNIGFIVANVLGVISLFFNPLKLKGNKLIIFFPFLFIGFYLLSGLLSYDLSQGLLRLNAKLIALLIPLPLVIYHNNFKSLEKLKLLIVSSFSFYTLILLGIATYKWMNGASMDKFMFHDFTAPLVQHAVYYALMLSLGLIICIDLLLKNKNRHYLYLSFIIMLLGMLLCASKAIFLSFLVVLCIYLIQLKNRNLSLSLGILSLMIIGFLFLNPNNLISQRITEGLEINDSFNDLQNKQFSYEEKQNISDIELRVLLAKIAIEHSIKDGKVLFGYGIGDLQDNFDYHLMRYNLAPNWFQGFNVHNQYLDIYLSFGLVGLVSFLLFYVYLFKLAWKKKNLLWFLFLTIFSIAFIFEVYLNRNKGIVLFFFFNLFFYYQQERQVITHEQTS